MVSEMFAETPVEGPQMVGELQMVEEPHKIELVPDFDQKPQVTE